MSDPNIAPINQSPVPVGSVDEAIQNNLDPQVYATCARPNKLQGVVGCSWYDKCRVAAKGKAGPRFYGIQVLLGPSQGGHLVRNTTDCMWLAGHVDDIEDNKGSVQVIANEGEKYKKITSVLVDNATNEISVNPFNPQARREERQIEVEVPAWPRPGQNKELLHDMLRAETAKAEKERRSDEQLTRNLGLGESVVPLDKRDVGGGKRGPKAG